MVARGLPQGGALSQIPAYYAQNVAAGFIFLALAAGLAAVTAAFLKGRSGAARAERGQRFTSSCT